MPEKPLQIAAYAAGASLAAVTLVYVFAPTFFLDDQAAQSSRASRKRGVVGLSNPANDCFINSVLQVLAGLPDLRLHLIREVHTRGLGGDDVYGVLPRKDKDGAEDGKSVREKQKDDPVAPFKDKPGDRTDMPDWKILSMQRGEVTHALKEMLDALNERPIYKKTLSAQGFVAGLQDAFRTRINRNQQDAQEFLQLVLERLDDEYRAGQAARSRAGLMRRVGDYVEDDRDSSSASEQSPAEEVRKLEEVKEILERGADVDEEADGTSPDGGSNCDDDVDATRFPFEGKIESQIECLHCHFKPKATSNSFVTLTLHVPQSGKGTTLSSCFDGVLKVEHIDDFKCAFCRIQHAIDAIDADLAKAKDEKATTRLQQNLQQLKECLTKDPEKPPKNVTLPSIALAPQRRISRHSRIASFPALLAIHLSRSMWDGAYSSTKNVAKVSFPETLQLGGLLDQVTYRLLGVVTHKGVHSSGHYESFRRQFLRQAYSTPATMGTLGPYSDLGSPITSGASTPTLRSGSSKPSMIGMRKISSSLSMRQGRSKNTNDDHNVPSSSSSANSPSVRTISASIDGTMRNEDITSPSAVTAPTLSPTCSSSRTVPTTVPPLRKKSSLSRASDMALRARAKKDASRWWRISDESVKECTTKAVLKMESEVYMLFYELVPKS